MGCILLECPFVTVVLNNGLVALHVVDVLMTVVLQVIGKAEKWIANLDYILLEVRFVAVFQNNLFVQQHLVFDLAVCFYEATVCAAFVDLEVVVVVATTDCFVFVIAEAPALAVELYLAVIVVGHFALEERNFAASCSFVIV